jgi:LysR family carnitine catabolism transcriptional activator
MLDLGDLEAFVEAAKVGTFSSAAATLYTTQPSLSRRIARLEHQLGGALFDRSNRRSPHLAPLGEVLLPYARQLLADHAGFAELARAYSQGRRGTIAIVVSEATAELALPTLYRYIDQRFEELSLRVMERPPGREIAEALLEREADVGFIGRSWLDDKLDSITFGVTNHVAVGRPRFLGTAEEPIEWDEVRKLPLLLGARPDRTLFPVDREPLRVVFEGGYPGLLRTMARAEMGVIILGGVRKSEGLVCRPIIHAGVPQQSELQLAWAHDRMLAAPAKRLIEDLKRRLDRHEPPLLEEHSIVSLMA